MCGPHYTYICWNVIFSSICQYLHFLLRPFYFVTRNTSVINSEYAEVYRIVVSRSRSRDFSIMHNLINIQGIFPDFKLLSFFLPPTQNKRNNKNDTYVYICTLRFSFDFIMVWGTCLKHISLLFSDINKYLFFHFINVL